jgi:uncharacterized protein (DUF433 family)
VGEARVVEWQTWAAHVRSKRPPETIEQLADDLARQVAQIIGDFPGVTFDDLRAALDRLDDEQRS